MKQIYEEFAREFPELQRNPERWRRTIEVLVEARPKDQPDHVFKAHLQESIRQELQKTPSAPLFSWQSLFIGSLGSLGVMAAIMLVFWQSLPDQITAPAPQEHTTLSNTSARANALIAITEDTQSESFGTLTYNASAGNVAKEQAVGEIAVSDVAFSTTSSRIMPPIHNRRINISYTLDETLPEIPKTVTVYRKETITESITPDLFGQAAYLPIKAEELQNPTIQSLSFRGTIDNHAYTFTTTITDGTVSFHQEQDVSSIMPTPRQYTPTNRVADDELLAIATQFLTTLQVDTSALGTPVIDKPWETDPTSTWVPETMTITFPLEINGTQVRTEWGALEGVSIAVHQGTKTVQYGTIPRIALRSSQYETLAAEELRTQALRGGLTGIQYSNPEEEITVKLTKPRLELRSITTYNEQSVTHFIPVLVFDTIRPDNDPNRWIIPEQITVPLSKNTTVQ